MGIASDINGCFNLELPVSVKKTDSVSFTILGYKTVKSTIAELQKNTNTILISKTDHLLNNITVKHKRRKQRKLKYKKLKDIKAGLFSFSSVLVDNKIYISGGDKSRKDDPFKKALTRANEKYPEIDFFMIINEWEPDNTLHKYNEKFYIYDVEKNTWTKADAKFDNRAYHNINRFENNLYVLGGKKITGIKKTEYLHNTIDVYDLKIGKIKTDKTNPHQAVNFGSFVYKDNIIVMGGSTKIKKNGDKVYTDKIHQYNLTNRYWYEVDKMNTPKEVSGILIKDKIYTIGGFNKNPLNSIDSWNSTTGEWTNEGELFARIEKPALTSDKNVIYVYNNGELFIYNTIQKTLLKYNIDLYLKSAEMHFCNDTLYIVGGYSENEFSTTPSSRIYSVAVSEFKRTKIMEVKNL